MRLQLRIAGIVGAALPLMAAAPLGPPAGWRELTEVEVRKATETAAAYYSFVEGRWGSKYAIQADFDGDGREDRAAVLLNDRKARFALFVRLAKDGRYRKLSNGDDVAALWDWSVWLIEPGAYPSACGRGLGDGRAPCIPTIRNRWPGIAWGQNESGVAMFFWDGRRFHEEFLLD